MEITAYYEASFNEEKNEGEIAIRQEKLGSESEKNPFILQIEKTLKAYNWTFVALSVKWIINNKESYLETIKAINELCGLKNSIDDIEEDPQILKYCWKSSLQDYLSTDCSTFLNVMSSNYKKTLTPILFPNDNVSQNIQIWREEYTTMHDDLAALEEKFPNLFHIIFEYTIKGTSGSRPDVLLVSSNVVVIIEYKNHVDYKKAESNVKFQTSIYYRELSEMHTLSANSLFITVGFFGKTKTIPPQKQEGRDNYYFCTPGFLFTCITTSLANTKVIPCDVNEWINSPMSLRPDLIKGIQHMWKGKNLADARINRSSKTGEALSCLQKNIIYAAENKKHLIAFVSGVPGAGKTYLGLQLVFDNCRIKDYGATYYSGNGPLVEVLGSKIPVAKSVIKGIYQFKADHYQDFNIENHDIKTHVIVFDEGQRAWDNIITKGNSKFFLPETKVSEPDFILRTLWNHTDWCFLIVLIGDGQAIHTKETNDPAIWKKALEKNPKWAYIHSPNYSEYFPKVEKGRKVRERAYLQLNINLRSILLFPGEKGKTITLTSDLATWLLKPDRLQLVETLKLLLKREYEIDVVRNLEEAKILVQEHFSKDQGMAYGLLTSSKNKDFETYNLKQVKTQKQIENSIRNGEKNNAVPCSEWYETLPEKTLKEHLFPKKYSTNSHKNKINSCQLLTAAADEFSCQGLELDYTILIWGTDMVLNNGKWDTYTLNKSGERSPITKEIEKSYRFNSYRVLLSRARYGMVIYVPDLPVMNETFRFMQEAILEARKK